MKWENTLFAVLSCAVIFHLASASHFRGAVVQWRPINTTRFDGQIEISHRIGWRRSWSSSTSCQSSDIGTTRNFGFGSLTCQTGCSSTFSLQFFCTDFDVNEDWLQGSKSLTYNIGSSVTYFEASYDNCCWITLNNGGGSAYWSVRVKGTLSPRSDNGRINTSPVTAITPIVRLKQGCTHRISIPHQDADQDDVRCRWASGNECAGICGALSGSTLDQAADPARR